MNKVLVIINFVFLLSISMISQDVDIKGVYILWKTQSGAFKEKIFETLSGKEELQNYLKLSYKGEPLPKEVGFKEIEYFCPIIAKARLKSGYVVDYNAESVYLNAYTITYIKKNVAGYQKTVKKHETAKGDIYLIAFTKSAYANGLNYLKHNIPSKSYNEFIFEDVWQIVNIRNYGPFSGKHRWTVINKLRKKHLSYDRFGEKKEFTIVYGRKKELGVLLKYNNETLYKGDWEAPEGPYAGLKRTAYNDVVDNIRIEFYYTMRRTASNKELDVWLTINVQWMEIVEFNFRSNLI